MEQAQSLPVRILRAEERQTLTTRQTAARTLEEVLDLITAIYRNGPADEELDPALFIFCDDDSRNLMPIRMFLQDDAAKQALALIAPGIGPKLNAQRLVMVTEGWTLRLSKNSPEFQLYMEGKLRPSESESRIEVLNLIYQDEEGNEYATCFDIERDQLAGTVRLHASPEFGGVLEKLHADEEPDFSTQSRWHFFPAVHARRTTN